MKFLLWLLPFILVLLNNGVGALSCYHYTNADESLTVVHNKSYCTSDFFEEFKNASFTGAGIQIDGVKYPSTDKIGTEPFCTKALANEKDGSDWKRHMCYCFQEYCNYPFTYSEFVFRGFTISPVFPTNEDVFPMKE
ncbi:unnamed protein product [Caenorhabditis brenneri]